MDVVSARDGNTESILSGQGDNSVRVLNPTYPHNLQDLPRPKQRNYILIYINQ